MTAAPPSQEAQQQEETVIKTPTVGGVDGDGGGEMENTNQAAFSLAAGEAERGNRSEAENVAVDSTTAADEPVPVEDVVMAEGQDSSCAPVAGAEDGESEGVAGDLEAGDHRPGEGDSEDASGAAGGTAGGRGSRDSDFDGVLASYLDGSFGEHGGSLLMPLGGLRLLR